MTQYLVELYTPKAAWLALSTAQRTQFLQHIGAAMAGLFEQGVEVLTLCEVDAAVDQRTAHRFLGVWRFSDVSARDALLAGIRASGWYDYFDHVNAAGGQGDFAQHVAALASAEAA